MISLTLAIIIQIVIVRIPNVSKIFELECIPLYTAISLIFLTIPVITVMELFKKYKMFKESIKDFYSRIVSTSKVYEEKVCVAKYRFDL